MRGVLLTAALLATTCGTALAQTSDWAKIVNGKLVCQATTGGDRIMDFSTAGFAGGGYPLPANGEISVRITLRPSGGDDTDRIQDAIDTVSLRDLGSARRTAAGPGHS